MLENALDLGGNDLIWRNKPQLPLANEENRKLEEELKQKKIEIEKLKVILENNTKKGESMRDHFNDLLQALSYKQQLIKSREHEVEMEVHAQKLLERECSRLEQEIKAVSNEINTLKHRQAQRKAAIAEQKAKSKKLKSSIQMDEDALLHYLEESAQMEKDKMALIKYSSEDDSKINELELMNERLSKEAYERKGALEDADTEVFIVQSELDRIQEEFQNAYKERNKLITNWEKVMNQIRQRNEEIKKLSDHIIDMRKEETQLKQIQKEQIQLLSTETARNDDLELKIRTRDTFATKLRNDVKEAHAREEDLKAQLSTERNVSNYLLMQKQATENAVRQLEKQMEQKNEKLEEVKKVNQRLEKDIEILNKETYEADHYIKELEELLQKENNRNLKIQKEVAVLVKEILSYNQEIKELKAKEKFMESEIKNCQADIRNMNTRIGTLDRLRAKQESEMYEIESGFEKLQRRVKKMAGETNEEERLQIDAERSRLLSILEEKKASLNMITEELKTMMEKIAVATKDLEANKKLNSELEDKIKFLEFYITNSQKALKCSIARKQELLVQECLVKFETKRYQKILNSRNKSVFNLQKSKAEFEAMVKERTVELKNCSDLLDAEIRTEEDECGLVKKKLLECKDKISKLQAKYKIIMDALGVSEPGESAEAEMLIKAEDEKRDLQHERDKLMSKVLKNEEELSALKNTLWLINTANEQFKDILYPPGISSEDSEALKNSEVEGQNIAIQLHITNTELKSLQEDLDSKTKTLNEKKHTCEELQDVIADREAENEVITKEIADLGTKLMRADKSNSRLSLDIKKRDGQTAIEEDIRIHLLREIRRTVSDMLFATVESKPEISAKIQQLFNEAQLPIPSRTRSFLSSRSSSVSSSRSRGSSKPPSPNARGSSGSSSPSTSGRSSRSEIFSPSVVMLGSMSSDSPEK